MTNTVATAGDAVDQAINVLNSLYGLPGHLLVGITCIIVGYMLRLVRRFPNDGIPLVCICWGMIFNPLVADANPAVPYRLWLARNILIGLIIGAGAWAIHRYVIKKFEEKIPILGPVLADADRRSDEAAIIRAADKAEDAAKKSVDTQ